MNLRAYKAIFNFFSVGSVNQWKEIFLEDLHGTIVEKEKEEEANQFSQEFLFSYEKMKDLLREGISDESIKSYARELN